MKAQKTALEYHIDKKENVKKGKQISHTKIKNADYLLPECFLSVKDKMDLFSFDMKLMTFQITLAEKSFVSCLAKNQ